jgi:hypothetical protein
MRRPRALRDSLSSIKVPTAPAGSLYNDQPLHAGQDTPRPFARVVSPTFLGNILGARDTVADQLLKLWASHSQTTLHIRGRERFCPRIAHGNLGLSQRNGKVRFVDDT